MVQRERSHLPVGLLLPGYYLIMTCYLLFNHLLPTFLLKGWCLELLGPTEVTEYSWEAGGWTSCCRLFYKLWVSLQPNWPVSISVRGDESTRAAAAATAEF